VAYQAGISWIKRPLDQVEARFGPFRGVDGSAVDPPEQDPGLIKDPIDRSFRLDPAMSLEQKKHS
jgi:hypothetical protein